MLGEGAGLPGGDGISSTKTSRVLRPLEHAAGDEDEPGESRRRGQGGTRARITSSPPVDLALDAGPRGEPAASRSGSAATSWSRASRRGSARPPSWMSAVRSTLRSTVASVRLIPSTVVCSDFTVSFAVVMVVRASATSPSTLPIVLSALFSVWLAVPARCAGCVRAPRRSPESTRPCTLLRVSRSCGHHLVDRHLGDLLERLLDLLVQPLHSGRRGRHLGPGGLDVGEARLPVGVEVELDRLLPAPPGSWTSSPPAAPRPPAASRPRRRSGSRPGRARRAS